MKIGDMTPEQIKAEIERVQSMELSPYGLPYTESVTRRINEIELQVICLRQTMSKTPEATATDDHRQTMTESLAEIETAVSRMRASVRTNETRDKN